MVLNNLIVFHKKNSKMKVGKKIFFFTLPFVKPLIDCIAIIINKKCGFYTLLSEK